MREVFRPNVPHGARVSDLPAKVRPAGWIRADMERTVDPQEQAEEVVQDAFAALLPAFVRIDNPDPDLERRPWPVDRDIAALV